MARPTIFSEELADAICERLAAGESLIRICGGDDFPSDGTVYRWIATIPAFRDKYAQARSVQAERMADEILDIADDGRNDKWTDSEGVVRVDKRGDLLPLRIDHGVLRGGSAGPNYAPAHIAQGSSVT